MRNNKERNWLGNKKVQTFIKADLVSFSWVRLMDFYQAWEQDSVRVENTGKLPYSFYLLFLLAFKQLTRKSKGDLG